MKKIVSLLSVALALSACGHDMKTKMGLVKQAPDEFMVISRAPLTLPPDYDLRPVSEAQAQVKSSDFDELGASERSFLNKVDAQSSNGDIKTTIDKELKELKK